MNKKNIQTILNVDSLPDHEPDRFSEYKEIQNDGKKAFELKSGEQFYLDEEGGWTDEQGCYYTQDGEADGWFVKCEDEQLHFYDIDGKYLPTDEEDIDKLPEHQKEQPKFHDNFAELGGKEYDLDPYGGFEDNQGCYYDSEGRPSGWVIKKRDGRIYLFDMDGQYLRDMEQIENNDFDQFDTEFVKKKSPLQQQKVSRKVAKYLYEYREQQKSQVQKKEQEKQQKQSQQQQQPQQTQPQYQQQSKYSDKITNIYKLSIQEAEPKSLQDYIKKKLENKNFPLEWLYSKQVLTVKVKGGEIEQFSNMKVNDEFEYDGNKKGKLVSKEQKEQKK